MEDSYFVAWPEIEKFSTMIKNARGEAGIGDQDCSHALSHNGGKLGYRGKIKLHGTNSGVVVTGDKAIPQSRTRSLIGADNEGFARWCDSHKSYFSHLISLKTVHKLDKLIVFGEWCGKGIMRGAAICEVPERQFCIFALRFDDELLIDPAEIEEFVLNFKGLDEEASKTAKSTIPSNMKVLPWQTDEFHLDLKAENESLLETQISEMNKLIEAIDNEDPWVKKHFNVSGPGEGIVWYPIGLTKSNRLSHSLYGKFVFKAKGDKHLVVKQSKPIQTKVEAPAGVTEFVDMFVTQNRLEQGVREACGDKYDKKNVGKFIQWMSKDVEKESKAELTAAGLTFKQVDGPVKEKARAWYLEKSK